MDGASVRDAGDVAVPLLDREMGLPSRIFLVQVP